MKPNLAIVLSLLGISLSVFAEDQCRREIVCQKDGGPQLILTAPDPQPFFWVRIESKNPQTGKIVTERKNIGILKHIFS